MARHPDNPHGWFYNGMGRLVDGFLPGVGSGAPGGRGATTAARGRPADVLQLPDGSILISDDSGNRLIRVSYNAAGGK